VTVTSVPNLMGYLYTSRQKPVVRAFGPASVPALHSLTTLVLTPGFSEIDRQNEGFRASILLKRPPISDVVREWRAGADR